MNRAKRLVLSGLVNSGLGLFLRRATRDLPRIVMYHGFCDDSESGEGIPTSMFERQLQYIKRCFTPWKLSDMIAYRSKHNAYPRHAVAITVDDGYESFYSRALPLLREYEVPATVFVVAEAADRQQWLWPDILKYAFGAVGGAGDEQNRMMARLKGMPAAERKAVLEGFLFDNGIDLPAVPSAPYRLMSWGQLREASDSGLVEVGAHSCTHPIMSHLSTDESIYEIAGAKEIIEDRLNTSITSYCYPNGQPGDYTEKQMQALGSAGYSCCTASHEGLVEADSNVYALPRMASHPSDFAFTRFALDGFAHIYRKWRS